MLLSMTGYGEAHYQSEALTLAIELRTVNNRYLKVSVRAAEPYNLMEAEFEKVIRSVVRRGSVQVALRCVRQHAPQDFRINTVALQSYLGQLRRICADLGLPGRDEALLPQVLSLPGVVPEPGEIIHDVSAEWPQVQRVLEEALDRLQAMRREEGQAMAQEFLQYLNQIDGQLARIRERTPQMVAAYRDRLHDRLQLLLAERDIGIDQKELIKEVAIFAERSDVAEEVVRLASHIDQFRDVVNEPESPGRKLEFLTQEMFREANTIGSKAGDVEISRCAVEIKGTLEKIRELVQNVE